MQILFGWLQIPMSKDGHMNILILSAIDELISFSLVDLKPYFAKQEAHICFDNSSILHKIAKFYIHFSGILYFNG